MTHTWTWGQTQHICNTHSTHIWSEANGIPGKEPISY